MIEKERIVFCVLYIQEGEDNEAFLKAIKGKGIEKITKIIEMRWFHYSSRIGILETQSSLIEAPVLIVGVLLNEMKKNHELYFQHGSSVLGFIRSIE